jgi:hypothetical protein
MFNWFQKQANSEEFLKLYRMLEEQKIKIEMIEINFQLLKKKFKVKAGIEEDTEIETNKNPEILLSPNGAILNDRKYCK